MKSVEQEGLVSDSTTVAQFLPFLRRYGRALTGSQASGDAYVVATLEALVADPSLIEGDCGPRVALYQLFTRMRLVGLERAKECGSGPISSPTLPRSIWVSATTFDRHRHFCPRLSLTAKFGFPETENRGFGDAVGMRGGIAKSDLGDTLAVALASCPNADQYAASPMISCCRAHSMGRSHRRAIPKPWGRCPSIAALTRSGARKASDTVMLTLRALHPVRLAMFSVVAAGSSISSLSQRRPCAIAAISVAFVSDRMGRGRCCDGSAGRRISRRLVGGVLLQGMWSVFVPSGWLPSAASVWFNFTINRSGRISTRST